MHSCKHLIEEEARMVKLTCYIHTTGYVCELHKFCVPNWRPKAAALEKWNNRHPECDIYKLCEYCPDKILEKSVEPNP